MFYKFLIDKIKNKKLIIVGELHGTKEIPEMLSNLFHKYAQTNDFNICMEIHENNQPYVDNFLRTGEENYLMKMPFFKYTEKSDGRNSREYFNLVKNVYHFNTTFKREIKIFCIDTSDPEDYKVQNKRESKIAENIIKILSEKKTFAILGAIHASKKPISFGKTNIIPSGAILFNKLKSKMFTINILPKKGKFFNIGFKEIFGGNSCDSFSEGFDYVFEIEEVSPCSFLN